MIFIGIILIIAASILVGVYLSNKKKTSLIESTETSTSEFLDSLAKSMTDGVGSGSLSYFTEVKGVIACAEPLVSELSKTRCVYYSMNIEREYEETYFEENPDGKREERTRRGAETVAQNQRSIPFYIEDGTGRIKVKPGGAEFIAERIHSGFEPYEAENSGFISIGGIRIELGKNHSTERRTIGYRFSEDALEIGREVYVIGEATDQGGELCMVTPKDKDKKFIISSKGEEELLKDSKTAMTWSIIGSVICGILGIAIIIISLLGK